MPNVVADACTLIVFEKAGLLDLLFQTWGTLLLPLAVYAEVNVAGKAGAANILGRPEVKKEISVPVVEELADLGAGEAAAISLALERSAVLLTDDKKARSRARELGLTVRGSLGTLARAKQLGHIAEVRPCLDALRAAGLYLRQELCDEFLRSHGERP